MVESSHPSCDYVTNAVQVRFLLVHNFCAYNQRTESKSEQVRAHGFLLGLVQAVRVQSSINAQTPHGLLLKITRTPCGLCTSPCGLARNTWGSVKTLPTTAKTPWPFPRRPLQSRWYSWGRLLCPTRHSFNNSYELHTSHFNFSIFSRITYTYRGTNKEQGDFTASGTNDWIIYESGSFTKLRVNQFGWLTSTLTWMSFLRVIEHFISNCPVVLDYIQAGKCKRDVNNRIILPTGAFIPHNIPGALFKDHLDEWPW